MEDDRGPTAKEVAAKTLGWAPQPNDRIWLRIGGIPNYAAGIYFVPPRADRSGEVYLLTYEGHLLDEPITLNEGNLRDVFPRSRVYPDDTDPTGAVPKAIL